MHDLLFFVHTDSATSFWCDLLSSYFPVLVPDMILPVVIIRGGFSVDISHPAISSLEEVGKDLEFDINKLYHTISLQLHIEKI